MKMPTLEKDLMVSAGVAAAWLRFTPRRLQQAVKEGWMPKVERGKYPLIQCMYARIEYQDQLLGGGSDESANLYGEKVKLAKLDVAKREMEYAREQGLLVDIRSAAFLWNQILLAMKTKLMGLPVRAAPMVRGKTATKTIREILKRIVQEACDELRNLDPADYLDAGDRFYEPATTPGSDSRAVGRRKKKAVTGRKRGTRTVEH